MNTTADDIFYVTDQAWLSSPSTTGSISVVQGAGVPLDRAGLTTGIMVILDSYVF